MLTGSISSVGWSAEEVYADVSWPDSLSGAVRSQVGDGNRTVTSDPGKGFAYVGGLISSFANGKL
jgi:hypothetical protein